MQNKELVATTLNGLIRINNDRIDGYKDAMENTTDESLKSVFTGMYNESLNFVNTLGKYVRDCGETPATDGTLAGNVHQGWLNFKAAILGQDREAILGSCEFGDKAAIEAYDTALEIDDIEQHSELSGVLTGQKASIEQSLRVIQSLANSTSEVNETH